MSARKIGILALVLALMGVERFAYYTTRATFVIALIRRGVTDAAASALTGQWTALMLVGSVLGGAIAIAIGPRVVTLVASAIATLGYVVLAAGAPPGAFVVIGGLGVGMLKPCAWAIVADEVAQDEAAPGVDPRAVPASPRRFVLGAAMMILLYAAINAGGFLAPLLSGFVAERGGAEKSFMVSVAAMFVVLVLAAAIVVAAFRRVFAPTAPSMAIAGAAVLLAAAIPFELGTAIATDPGDLYEAGQMWLFAINPVVVIVASIVAFVLLLVAALGRWRPSLATGFGGALVASAIGMAVIAAAFATRNVAVFVGGTAIAAAAEPIVSAIGLTYASLAVGPRWRTLVVAGWLFLTQSSSISSAIARSDGARLAVLAVVALYILFFGIALLVFGRRMHERWFER